MGIVEVRQGGSPVVLGLPHTGTDVPADVWQNLNANGRLLADTDWHIEKLYNDLLPDVTTVRATFHRYVIDANRDPTGASLYPGQNTTGLISDTDFDGKAIWQEGKEPTAADIAARLQQYHAPYHAALAQELERVRAIHGVAVLYDCHSIRANIPFLFEGRLPDFNIGTASGASCHPDIETAVADTAASAPGFTSVLNGRFKGGWTTRHYGRPREGLHAIQMELAQITHLASEFPPFAYDAVKAARLRPHLQSILLRIEEIAHRLAKEERST